MKKILFSLLAVFMVMTVAVAPVYAEEKCVITSIMGNAKCDQDGSRNDASGKYNCSCDDGDGSSVKDTLKLVVRIFTIGVGVFAALGITIVGIQYLTAGSNEEKTRKAKRRLFEIVLGILAFVLIYAILSWLLPSFNPNEIWR